MGVLKVALPRTRKMSLTQQVMESLLKMRLMPCPHHVLIVATGNAFKPVYGNVTASLVWM